MNNNDKPQNQQSNRLTNDEIKELMESLGFKQMDRIPAHMVGQIPSVLREIFNDSAYSMLLNPGFESEWTLKPVIVERETVTRCACEHCKKENSIIHEIRTERDRAEHIYPDWPTDPVHAVNILTEEVGKAAQEANRFTFRKNDSDMQRDRLRQKLITSGAMVLRCLINLESYQAGPDND